MVPHDDIARVVAAQRRFDEVVAGLTDRDARRPSRCPGWTLGHLLTHVARNADSHVRRTEAAIRGEIVDQYPGGFEGRAAAIEAGANRSAAELVADVRETNAAVERAWSNTPAEAWDRVTRDVGGRERPLHELVGRRWQEVEVHVVDLDLGVTYRDWTDDFVAVWLPRLRAYAGDAVEGIAGIDDLDDREQLAWLYGRLSRPDLPPVPAWG